MQFVPSFRRALAVGVALAVVPATIALASPSHAAKTAARSAGVPAVASLYPFGSTCAFHAPVTSRANHADGSVTFTIHPTLNCDHIKTRMHVGANLWRNNSPTALFSVGDCRVGVQVPECKYVAAPRRSATVSSTGKHATWFTRINYSVQGPDALFFAQRNSRNCRFESQSVTAFCSYIVDRVTL